MIIIASSCYGFVFIRYASPITTNICITLIVRVLILGKLHSDVRVYIPPKTVFDQAWSRTDTQILLVILCAAARVAPRVMQNSVKAAKLYVLCDEAGINHKGRCHMLHTAPSISTAIRNGNRFCSSGWRIPCQPTSSIPPP